MQKIEAAICTLWAVVWFIMIVNAYNPERHSVTAVIIAWLFLGVGPVLLYRFLSR